MCDWCVCVLQIAVDSVDNIRTVASLGLENTLFNHYAGEITRPYRLASPSLNFSC